MKDFKHWGIKKRVFPEFNYIAVWVNLKTLRLGEGQAKELEYSEFYDVSLGSKCNLECPFCYTDAKRSGRFYTNITEKAKFFFGQMSDNEKPFQIAIGSEGEPTIHPEFIEFLKTVYDLGIVPNYTTNGISIANDDEYSKLLIDATNKYCGGVAISANTWSDNINSIWRKAVNKIYKEDININLHCIISDKKSIDNFIEIYNEYKDKVLYFVILPLMDNGRSQNKYTEEAFEYLLSFDLDHSKIAFGAHLYNSLLNQTSIDCYLYPPESLSKNLLLDDDIKITKSSFDLEPIKIIKYETK